MNPVARGSGPSHQEEIESMLGKANGMMIAAIMPLAMLGSCGDAAHIEDSPEARIEMARKVVKLEIENGDLDQRLDRGADLAQAYSLDTLRLELGRELTDQELDRVREIMRSVLGEFLTAEAWEGILTEVYAKHFTAHEMHTIYDFFNSPAGKKVMQLSGQMMQEIDSKTDVVFEGQMDAFVGRIDEELGKAFPALLEGES
jgi:hypothetical protein